MFDYFVDTIWKIDLILFIAAFSLILVIFAHSLIQNAISGGRTKQLWTIKKALYQIRNTGNAETWAILDVLFRKTTPKIFLDVMTNRMRQNVFFNESEQKQFRSACLSEKNLARFQRIAQTSMNKWRRIEALLALGYTEDEISFKILKEGLESKDPEISYFSAVGLGQQKHPASAQALVVFLKTNAAARYKTASILAQFPSGIATQVIPLIQDSDPDVRFWGIRIIAGLKNNALAPDIEKLLEDSSQGVRAAACQYLGAIRYQPAAEKIKIRLKDDAWNVRAQGLLALEKILGDRCIPEALGLITDNSWLVLEKLKQVLAEHLETALPYLEKFFSGTDRLSKKICVEVLGMAGYAPKLFEDLLTEGEKKERAMRLIQGLLETGSFETLESVARAFNASRWQEILNALERADKILTGKIRFMLNARLKT